MILSVNRSLGLLAKIQSLQTYRGHIFLVIKKKIINLIYLIFCKVHAVVSFLLSKFNEVCQFNFLTYSMHLINFVLFFFLFFIGIC